MNLLFPWLIYTSYVYFAFLFISVMVMTESYKVVQTILTERLDEVFVALVKLHICSKLCTDKDSQELEGERRFIQRISEKFI